MNPLKETDRLRRGLERIGEILQRDPTEIDVFLDRVLEDVIGMTESQLGYIYHYDEDDKTFVLNSWSKEAMASCHALERQTVYKLERTGLWGEAVRQRKPILVNDFDKAPFRKGLPPGHVPLRRFLTIPVMLDDRIVGVVGVANKQTDYDQTDLLLLTVVMGAVWKSLRRWEVEKEYRTLFQEMSNGFAVHEIICDPSGRPIDYRFLAANPAFEKLTGLKADAIVGKTVTEVIPSIESKWIEIYGKVALTGESISFDSVAGELGKHFEVTAYRPSPGKFATFFVDVTDREKATAELRRGEDRLRQAEKMEALGMLAGGIAHDFNNILGAILGFAEITQVMAGSDTPISQNLAKIVRSGKRAKKLIEQIQMYTMAAKPRLSPVRIGHYLAEVVEEIRAVAGPAVTIEAVFDERAGVVEIEPTLMHEALLNLGMNALHALESREGGRVRIGLERVDVAVERPARIGALRPGGYAKVEFLDTGCGMDAETLRRAFDPFFTTRRVGEGTGMGLAVVQGIARNHHGAIDVESKPGEGSTFRIWLPLSDRDIPEESAGSGWRIAKGKGEKILVVDDETMVLEVLQKGLVGNGYEVVCASSGTDAMQIFLRAPYAFSLLFTDQTMPGMSGAELARRVLAIRPELPVVLCSGYGADISQSRAKAIGIRRILSKPLELSDLLGSVREALDESRGGENR